MSQLANKNEEKYMNIYLYDMKYYYNQLGGNTLLSQFKHKPKKNGTILIAPDTIFGYFQRATNSRARVKGDAAEIKKMLSGTKPGEINKKELIKRKNNEYFHKDPVDPTDPDKISITPSLSNIKPEVLNLASYKSSDVPNLSKLRKDETHSILPFYYSNKSKQYTFGYDKNMKGSHEDFAKIVDERRKLLLKDLEDMTGINNLDYDPISQNSVNRATIFR